MTETGKETACVNGPSLLIWKVIKIFHATDFKTSDNVLPDWHQACHVLGSVYTGKKWRWKWNFSLILPPLSLSARIFSLQVRFLWENIWKRIDVAFVFAFVHCKQTIRHFKNLPLHRYFSRVPFLRGIPSQTCPVGSMYNISWKMNHPRKIRLASKSTYSHTLVGSLGNVYGLHDS